MKLFGPSCWEHAIGSKGGDLPLIFAGRDETKLELDVNFKSFFARPCTGLEQNAMVAPRHGRSLCCEASRFLIELDGKIIGIGEEGKGRAGNGVDADGFDGDALGRQLRDRGGEIAHP